MNQKPNEIGPGHKNCRCRSHGGQRGWMYHMSNRDRSCDDPTTYPPPSQIPGLNGEEMMHDEDEDDMRGWIKDTDSKYIQLAKAGGRKDLLRFRENFTQSKVPKGYPRCEWFYIEDNKMEDGEKEEEQGQGGQYVPKLPDYMVYEYDTNKAVDDYDNQDKFRPKRLPYATDTTTVYERTGAGRSATDKTVAIPETRRVGYGIRNDKQKYQPVKWTPTEQRGKPRSREMASRNGTGMPNDDEKPVMGKLMSGKYEEEWHDRYKSWRKDQDQKKPKIAPKKKDPLPPTVYQESYGPPPVKREVKHGRRAGQPDGGDDEHEIKREFKKMEKDLEKEELFKLTKFKKVPARIDTHRHPSPQRTPKQEMVY